MTRILTDDHLKVLELMREKNVGAVWFEGNWRFPETFRRQPMMAQRYLRQVDQDQKAS